MVGTLPPTLFELRRTSRFAHPTHFCHGFVFSRRMASEFFHQSTLIENRGRREGRVPFAPMVRVQQKSTRQNHRYEPNNRPSLRNGFNGLLRALPGETGLCCHRRLASSRKARHLHRGARTTRLHRPRHVVRLTTCRVHRIPLPTSVTIAKRPSCGSETCGSIVVICPTTQEEMCTTGSLRMAGMRSRDSLHVIASARDLSAGERRRKQSRLSPRRHS
jgi:hypothetical protein